MNSCGRSSYISLRTLVSAWVASDVCHYYITLFDLELEHITETQAQLAPVDITAYGTHGAVRLQLVYDYLAAYVSCMPYLIAVGKMVQVSVVPPAVCVRHETYALHNARRCLI